MGNCFAACSQRKQSVTEIPSSVGKASTSRFTNESLTSANIALKKLRRNKHASATIPKVWSRGRKNRVSPCNNSSAGNAGCMNGSNPSSRASQPSDSSDSSVSSLGTLSNSSSYEDYLSGRCQSFDENEKTRTPTPFIQPGITMGRLIIVQPCRSVSSSYVENSPENVPCGSSSKMPTNEEPEAVESFEIFTSTSSIGSWTDDPLDIELDELSEEESCQVFPYRAGI